MEILQYMQKTWAEISLDNLEKNYHALRAHVPAGTRFLGVVKADAYGHGAVPVARRLQELGAEYFAVSSLDEAIQLRRGGVTAPVLIMGYTAPEYAIELALLGIEQEVHALDYARALSRALPDGQTLGIHLKLDTGMSRLGFFCYDRPETIGELVQCAGLPHLRLAGCYTHFAVADSLDADDAAYTALQFSRFQQMLAALRAAGVDPGLCHAANSGASLANPAYALDMIRPGIATYGCAPSAQERAIVPLAPLLSWKTTVCQVRDFPAGVPVSYGRIYTTTRPTRLAVLAVGYADGLPIALSNRMQVLLHGRRVPVVGRICMDMCMADVSDLPQAAVGDTATIIGTDGGETITAEDFAELAGTICYESLCSIGKRVPRIYLAGGKRVDELRYIV